MGDERLLREWVRLVLERERRKKPGGPRTDIGALRQLNKDGFTSQVRAAVKTAGGDAEKAANELGVAQRTLYYYLDDEPSLNKVRTTADRPSSDADDRKPEEKKKG